MEKEGRMKKECIGGELEEGDREDGKVGRYERPG